MFTVQTTRNHYGTTMTDYFGSFADTDSACDAAVKIESSPMHDTRLGIDVVPIPDGVTPKPLATDYL